MRRSKAVISNLLLVVCLPLLMLAVLQMTAQSLPDSTDMFFNMMAMCLISNSTSGHFSTFVFIPKGSVARIIVPIAGLVGCLVVWLAVPNAKREEEDDSRED